MKNEPESRAGKEIEELEEEIRKTPYNKATQKHIGLLKAKLARLRAEGQRPSGKGGKGFSIKKAGDATVLLLGFPSVGKSTLLNRITSAESKVGEYEFTTLDVIPGTLLYRGARIQVLDLPGVIEGASSGKGRGREILSAARNADLVLIMVSPDAGDLEEQAGIIRKELYSAGFRLNQRPPDIRITRKETGGIRIGKTKAVKAMSEEVIRSVLKEFGILNAEVLIREDADVDRLIDSLMRNRVYVPSIVVVNKIDIRTGGRRPEDAVEISAREGTGIEELKEVIWDRLGLIRIYMKRPGKEADMGEPFIFRQGCRVIDVCRKVHKEMERDFGHARVWGPSARFPGQKVGASHVLKEGDVVELHT